MNTDTRLLIKVPLCVMAVSAGYATTLAMIERKLRLKPDHEWLEVAVGVGLTLVPVAIEAHTIETKREKTAGDPVNWKTYEGAIWRSFLAAGTPIIFWQIGESIFRKLELMKYLSRDDEGNPRQPLQIIYAFGKRAAGGFTANNTGSLSFHDTSGPDDPFAS